MEDSSWSELGFTTVTLNSNGSPETQQEEHIKTFIKNFRSKISSHLYVQFVPNNCCCANKMLNMPQGSNGVCVCDACCIQQFCRKIISIIVSKLTAAAVPCERENQTCLNPAYLSRSSRRGRKIFSGKLGCVHMSKSNQAHIHASVSWSVRTALHLIEITFDVNGFCLTLVLTKIG